MIFAIEWNDKHERVKTTIYEKMSPQNVACLRKFDIDRSTGVEVNGLSVWMIKKAGIVPTEEIKNQSAIKEINDIYQKSKADKAN